MCAPSCYFTELVAIRFVYKSRIFRPRKVIHNVDRLLGHKILSLKTASVSPSPSTSRLAAAPLGRSSQLGLLHRVMAAGRHENPAHNRGHVHWRAPSSMVGFLLAGCLFALSHHLLNQSLNGREASNETHSFAGWKFSGQQLTVTAGTAFAFAVKACLVLAVASSYAQLMFRAILDHDLRVVELDDLFGSLGSVISFVCIAYHFRYLHLTLLALLVW